MSISDKALVSSKAIIGADTHIWDFAQIRENANIGDHVVIGNAVYIDTNVRVGDNCKIQNRALIYDSAILHKGVFIGPGVVLTNDKNPRAISGDGKLMRDSDWVKVGVEVFEGASIGAGAICVAPIKIGKWALVGAGAVVTKDIRDHALVVGNPARQVGWVGKAGKQLETVDGQHFNCPIFGTEYELINHTLVEN